MNIFRVRNFANGKVSDTGLNKDRAIAEKTSEKTGDAVRNALDFVEREVDDGFFEETLLTDLAKALVGNDINREVPENIGIDGTEKA